MHLPLLSIRQSVNKSISKSRFSKVLPNFADEPLIASLQISVYWLSGSDVMLL